ncbi:endonuclease/exonuclease/phosphatase family protein [Luteolibacter sp. Populi]|uniref:endonuclease/exonuclease/phosphatase family protein n=1 Tax=Luteolibacter sp. Populi TaxID=3230487 RepID=UPI003466919E
MEIRVASFNIGAQFEGAAPVYSLGHPGTPDHESVKAVLARIDADVVSLEEIDSADLPDDVNALAASLGYTHIHLSPVSGSLPAYAAPIDNGLRVITLSRFPYLFTGIVASPPGAREMTRFLPVVKVDVPGTLNDPVFIGAHLKSGDGTDDRFRRLVEMKRLAGYLASQGLSEDDNYIIAGDFNLVGANRTYEILPNGLPASFDLGADITLPVTYSNNPLAYFSTPGVMKLDPRQLDGSATTFPSSGNVLDLMMVSPAIAGRMHGTEIYNSALDTSNTSGLLKAGEPLATGTSATASDHFALFGDFELDADLPNLQLALSLPAVLEGMPDGTVAVTVTLPAILPEAVNIVLSSDDAEAALPILPVLQIPAGQLSGSVGIRTPRNFLVDAQRSVTISALASGHDPDNAVLQVENSDGPYVLGGVGDIVTENFNGFAGNHDPAPWTTTGGMSWRGSDDGSSSTTGLRAYGSPADSSPGFLPDGIGTVTSATFVNGSPQVLTGLQIALDVEQWRSALGGRADTLSAAIFYDGSSIPLPSLGYTANTGLPSGAVSGGATTPLSATASGLAIPPGASFELRITFTPGPATVVLPSDIFVNEFHYDDASTDIGEFVEIAVAPGYTGPLSAVSLVLYNGNGGASYATHTLDTFTAGATTASGYRLFHKAIAQIQNDEDGMAVVASGTVLHFICYEGAVTATNGPAAGMSAVNIGVDQDPAPAEGVSSLGLTGTGGEALAFTWTQFGGEPYSPGQPNTGQTFSIPAPPSQGIAIDNLSVTFLAASSPDSDGDGIVDSSDPDDDNDTQSDADEIAFGTNPLSAASIFRPAFGPAVSPPGYQISFPGAQGITYTVESSADLDEWDTVGTFPGGGQTIVVPIPAGGGNLFVRVKAGE